MSQTITFDSAVRRLYFGIDIVKSSSSLVDAFLNVGDLHHNEKVIRQSDLNLYIQLKTDKEAWSSRHTFEFTKSPLPNLNIKSGYIEVTIGEAPKIKKLLDVRWYVDFDNKKDADIFFEQLKETFEPVSTIHKNEFDKDIGHVAQYSTRKPSENGIKDISFILGKSLQTKNYRISVLLLNEFIND
jgi:hypothetical protein